MRDLTKYEGGGYVQAGDHDLTVVSQKEIDKITTPNREYVLRNETGDTVKATFFLTPKAEWRLAKFAVACGLTKEQRQEFTFDMLCGCQVHVRVIQKTRTVDGEEKTYHEVDTGNVWPVGTVTTPPREGADARIQHPDSIPEEEDTRGADDIPF